MVEKVKLDTGETPLVQVYRKQLEAAGREDTPEGVHAIHLAKLLATPGHSASGAATLSRELRATMAIALKGASPDGDALDDLANRRVKKTEVEDNDAVTPPVTRGSAVGEPGRAAG